VTSRPPNPTTDSSVDTASLEARLRDVFGATARVVERETNRRSSSAASEIVVVASDARTRTLFVKHGADAVDRWSGHTRGVPHEIAAYERVVGPGDDIAPRYVASWAELSRSSLVVDFIPGAKRSNDPHRVVVAAAALGAWHARGAPLAATSRLSSLNDFGPGITTAIGERLADALDTQAAPIPVLERLVGLLDGIGERLAGAQTTFVHGECYPANVLIAGSDCYLVDWETAGIGCGELDLAALTAGSWASTTIDACDQAYAAARWPGGEPRGFDDALVAARVLVHAQLAWRAIRTGSVASAGRLTELLAEVAP
jgi:hypothetical protein